MIVLDATVDVSYIINQICLNPPAIYAEEGADTGLPSLDDYTSKFVVYPRTGLDHFSGSSIAAKATYVSTAIYQAPSDQSHNGPVEPHLPIRVDPWLEQTLKSIAAHRDLEDGWDNQGAAVPAMAALDTAEILARGFTSVPMGSRPQFMVDATGSPSFAAYNDSLYTHVIIDENGLVSWLSTFGDDERFEDEVKITMSNASCVAQRIVSA